jgi:8-oxo-dGTP pyrophosphatase MutT (NUDIX family)
MSSVVEDPRSVVRDLVAGVSPFDELEAADRQWMLDWIESGAPLFRLEKPASPPKHLAVYAAPVDEDTRSVMLVDHVKAKAWLMPGGHVDPDEDPRRTIVRELDEELRIAPSFHPSTGSAPLFLTVTQTRGAHSHTDVTLWFVFQADRDAPITPDPSEFSEVRWFELDRETGWAAEQFDPQMARFVTKLSQTLDRVTAGQ